MRQRADAKTAETSTETACGITSVAGQWTTPKKLLAWNRGHRQVKNGNHISPLETGAVARDLPKDA